MGLVPHDICISSLYLEGLVPDSTRTLVVSTGEPEMRPLASSSMSSVQDVIQFLEDCPAARVSEVDEPVIVVDENARIRRLSSGAESLLGYSESELAGDDITQVVWEGHDNRIMWGISEIAGRCRSQSTWQVAFETPSEAIPCQVQASRGVWADDAKHIYLYLDPDPQQPSASS